MPQHEGSDPHHRAADKPERPRGRADQPPFMLSERRW
jgi:hypothetical protein